MVIWGLLIFGILILLLALRIPVAYALGGLGLLILFFLNGIDGFGLVPSTVWSSVANYALITAPLFIFMGSIITHCGIGNRIYAAVGKLLHFLPGSLAISTTVGCAILGAVSGSSVATAAAVANIAVSEMRKQGYDMAFASGSVAAAGTLAIIIPPSIPMIIYGIITEQSIRDLFIAGVIPGIILTFLFSIYQIFHEIRKKSNERNGRGTERLSYRSSLSALGDLAPTAVLIIAVFGSMYAGVATITESAAIGVIGSLIIAFFYRSLSWENMVTILIESAKTSSMIGLIIVGASLFGYALTTSDIAPVIAERVSNSGLSPWAIFIAINLFLLFLGCFMEVLSILVITMPILFPIITKLGWDPVWFGIIVTVNMEMALITPPVGLNLYIVQGSVEGLSLETVAKGIIPFVGILCIGIAMFAIFPGIVLWLPKM